MTPLGGGNSARPRILSLTLSCYFSVLLKHAVQFSIGSETTFPNRALTNERELQNALETLSTLQELAERDLSELKKTIQARLSGTVRSRARELI